VSGTTADSEFPWLATNLVNSSLGEPFDGTEEYEIVVSGGTATVRFDAPSNASAVNGASFYLQNERGTVVEATGASLDEATGTVSVRFDARAVAPLVGSSDDFDVYGNYTDTEYDGQWVYRSSAVMNGGVAVSDGVPVRVADRDAPIDGTTSPTGDVRRSDPHAVAVNCSRRGRDGRSVGPATDAP
jgi:hypothetical protein